ncbi:MAG: hypothetical protein DME24_10425 [Verrucomicrobia bacterium]|nr:MAG: hypothetical protein DME24_10425 [Verrucomicrobiota bacterium]
MNVSGAHPFVHRRLKWLLALLICVGLAGVLFRKPIQDAILLRSLLMADSPSETLFQELADRAKDPFVFLQQLWGSEKIPHRELVAGYLKDKAGIDPELLKRAEPLLISATRDADMSVRELTLATLAKQKHPALPRVAAALLGDTDPQMRLLGIQYLRKQAAANALPLVFGLLDDPDLKLVTMADAALRNWTQQDFGVRVSMANFNQGGDTNTSPNPDNLKTIQAGVGRWKEWWNDHQAEYPANNIPTPLQPAAPERLPVADFALKDLNGRTVRFSEFKGKVVLLNFWATWCTACWSEIPDLIELQRKNADRLVILGISLDGQTEVDEHGHLTGTHSDEERHGNETAGKIDIAEIRAKVREFVKDKGINYPILLDPRNEVGRRFNGGELPTNVLIDREGYLRRRFIGGREVGVFEAMIDELLPRPAAPARDQTSTSH